LSSRQSFVRRNWVDFCGTFALLRLNRVKDAELLSGFLQHRRIGDRIAPINRLGLVTSHAHGRRAGDASAFEIAHGCPAKVMNETTWQQSIFARLLPSAAKILDATSGYRAAPAAKRMHEHPRYNRTCCLRDLSNIFALRFQDSSQFGRERKIAALGVLRFTRFKPEPTIFEIDVAPLTG